jgi:tripartite-type tricarboxylate transporter receptor subunit TctC
MQRRSALFVLGAAVLASGVTSAFAQGYPTRPIRLYVGFPPGAQTDSVARIVGAALADRLGQSVVIENRSGASGAIAAEAAARAPADGYTLLIGGNSNMVLAPLVFENLSYDPVQDFVPIGRIARVPLVAAVNAKVPASSFPELLALARANPATLTYASGALGTQVAVDLLMDSAGVKVINVPYKGTAPAITDVVAGRVDIIFADYAILAPHAHSGALRLLATTGAARGRETPNLPTVAELGAQGFAYYSWSSVMAPSGTPAQIVATLRQALRQVMRAPDFGEELERMGFEVVDEQPEALTGYIKSEIERFRPIVKRPGYALGTN